MKIENCSLALSFCIVIVLATSSFLPAQEINWQQDISLAKQLAAKENKLVLIHFSADWCRPCKNLERFVFTSPIVHEAIRTNTIPVAIDVDLHPELVKEFAVASVPVDVVITPAGRILTRRNSPKTVDGYVRMLKSLDVAVHDLDAGKPSIAQDLAELQHQLEMKTQKIAENNQFEPQTPSHTAPKLPIHAAKMARAKTTMLSNPFVEAKSKENTVPKSTGNFAKSSIASSTENPDSKFTGELAKVSELKGQDNDFPTGGVAMKLNSRPAEPIIIKNPSFNSIRTPSANVAAVGMGDMQGLRKNMFGTSLEQPSKKAPLSTSASIVTQKSPTPPNFAAESLRTQPSIILEDLATFALDGKCPVTLIVESKWVEGEQDWGCVHRGRTYLFSSQSNLAKFKKNPDKFSPLLAGYDPVIFRDEGRLVDGLEEFGVFMGAPPNQRVILFSSNETRGKFQFESNAVDYLKSVRQAKRSTDRGDTKMR